MHSLTVQTRDVLGSKTRTLRNKQIIPANLYGKGQESQSLQVSILDFSKIYHLAGQTSVIELHIDSEKKSHPAIISDIQLHPVSDRPIHIDFRQVNLKEKISLSIPIHFEGESQAINDGAMLVTIFDEIEVEALPQDMPEHLVADISKLLTLEDELTLADLNIDTSKITLSQPLDTLVARVEDSAMAEEIEEVIETEIINEKPDAAEGTETSESSETEEKTD